jgi:hypothetical protein
MDTKALEDLYIQRGFSKQDAAQAAGFLQDYQDFLMDTPFVNSTVDQVKMYVENLTAGIIPKEREQRLLALARAAHLSGLQEVYFYFVSILERDEIVKNIGSHIAKQEGLSFQEELYSRIPVPEKASVPTGTEKFTKALVEDLEDRLGIDRAETALRANAHGIPDESFDKEKEFFEAAENIDEYLKDYHDRSVAMLQRHADSGELWFEQRITQEVVDYVKSQPELLGAVRQGRTLIQTKIPFDPDRWLRSKDQDEKRFLACHCPMARASIQNGKSNIPGLWCNCSVAFVKQRYDVIFGRKTDARVLSSVLDGDEICRFAIEIPQHIPIPSEREG